VNQNNSALGNWEERASFAFRGRVKALGQSNLDGVEPDERMATVGVEEVVIAPRDVGDLTGKTITVYLQSTQGIEADQEAMFFATNWHYGNNIGVVEIGRIAVPATAEARQAVTGEARQAVVGERLRQLDENIEQRIRGAKLILSGRVLSTYRAEQTTDLPGHIEGVEWWNADMWVGTVEKGRPPAELRIWYPTGGDMDWSSIPKSYPEQEGVWFLRPVEEAEEGEVDVEELRRRGREEAEERLMAVDPLDYHAISDLPRIQALLWRMGEE
jgi:hypothetical protein